MAESAIFFVGHFFPNLFFKYFFIIFGENLKSLAQKMAESGILFFVGHFVFQIYFLNIFFRIFGENFKSLSWKPAELLVWVRSGTLSIYLFICIIIIGQLHWAQLSWSVLSLGDLPTHHHPPTVSSFVPTAITRSIFELGPPNFEEIFFSTTTLHKKNKF